MLPQYYQLSAGSFAACDRRASVARGAALGTSGATGCSAGPLIGRAPCTRDGAGPCWGSGAEADRLYVGHGLTGANLERPGLREALAACRAGGTLVVTKLDRLARSLPDARTIADELTTRKINLSLGGSVYDPTDAVGRLLGWPSLSAALSPSREKEPQHLADEGRVRDAPGSLAVNN